MVAIIYYKWCISSDDINILPRFVFLRQPCLAMNVGRLIITMILVLLEKTMLLSILVIGYAFDPVRFYVYLKCSTLKQIRVLSIHYRYMILSVPAICAWLIYFFNHVSLIHILTRKQSKIIRVFIQVKTQVISFIGRTFKF